MEQVLASDARFWGATDDETVQNAVERIEKRIIGE